MRVIKPSRLVAFGRTHPHAASPLARWNEVIQSRDWSNLTDLRQTFPSADGVTVGSGHTTTVFNIAGNHFRLITAIHYITPIVYLLNCLTHAQYSKNTGTNQL